MDAQQAEAVGRALAVRHREAAAVDRDASLLNYAERPRTGDWSMRAALTRFAQPHAVRAGQVLTLVRRLDAVLHHVVRPLERHVVTCDRELSPERLDGPPVEPYPDTRVADLARVQRFDPHGFAEVRTAYERACGEPLEDAEQRALPLLGVALDLEVLADRLTDWADAGPHDPPTAEVDTICTRVRHRLDELGVPVEQGPPPGHRSRRDRDA